MKLKRSYIFIVLLLLATGYNSAYGQRIEINNFAGGFTLATNGFGLNLSSQIKSKNPLNLKAINLEFQTIRNLNETKIHNRNASNPKSYVLGKVNAASTIRASIQLDRKLGLTPSNKPSLSVGMSFGPSLGLLKPYYIGYQDPLSENKKPQIIVQNEETLDNLNYIYGPANWTKGLNEISSTVGFHLDLHIKVNFSQSFYWQQWIAGVRTDFFSNDLNIMYNAHHKVFNSAYISYLIGSNP